MLILSAEDVRRALPMAEAVEAMKRAFAALSAGEADVPLRTHLRCDAHGGDVLVMPALLRDAESTALAVKVVSVFPRNAERNLPRINAAVLVIDPATGRPVACLEGGALTAIRTAAASGAATDLLARPDAKTVAILGAGVQARTHLEAVCTVRDIRTAWIYSPTRKNVEALIGEMSGRGPIPVNLRIAASADEAVSNADVICATTTATTPVFADASVRDGSHINAFGSYKPEVAEVPPETVARSLIIVDERAAAWSEAGDLIQPLRAGLIDQCHIHAELGELVLSKKPGRTSPEQITLFKSVGNAVQDAAAAELAVRNATKLQLGQTVRW